MIDVIKVLGLGSVFIIPSISQYILGSTYKINMSREFIHLIYTTILCITLGIVLFLVLIPFEQDVLILIIFLLYILLGFVNILLNNLRRDLRIIYLLIIVLLESVISIAFVYTGLI